MEITPKTGVGLFDALHLEEVEGPATVAEDPSGQDQWSLEAGKAKDPSAAVRKALGRGPMQLQMSEMSEGPELPEGRVRAIVHEVAYGDEPAGALQEALNSATLEDAAAIITGLQAVMGPDWFHELPIAVREQAVDVLLHVETTDAVRDTFNGIIDQLNHDRFNVDLATLKNPEHRAKLRESFKDWLVDPQRLAAGEVRNVKFGDASIPVPVAHNDQTMGGNLYLKASHSGAGSVSTEEVVNTTLAEVSPTGPDGEPIHLEGTVLYRPGLGNATPSASVLYRWAQHADSVVLMGTKQGTEEEQQLRPLTEFKGAPVPPELEGKIFVVGSLDGWLGDFHTTSGTFIEQLGTIREAAESGDADIDLSKIHAVGHSQGNVDIVLARLVLAAHGYPDAVTHHYALAPAFRGALASTGGGFSNWFAKNVGGDRIAQAVGSLAPQDVRAAIPEFMKSTVDWSMLGIIGHGTPSQFSRPMRSLFYSARNNGDFAGPGSDGRVDQRIKDFVHDPRDFHIPDVELDHQAIHKTPESADIALRSIGHRLPNQSEDVLGLLASDAA